MTIELPDKNQKEVIEEMFSVNEECKEEDAAIDAGSVAESGQQSRLCDARLRKAKAVIRLKYLKQRHQLQLEKEVLRQKMEELDAHAALEEAQSEEMILVEDEKDKEENREHAVPKLPEGIETTEKRLHTMSFTDSKLNSQNSVPSKSLPANVSSVTIKDSEARCPSAIMNVKSLAETMHEGINLPKPEILHFNGNPRDYTKFMTCFDANIECQVRSCQRKLNYLIQFCNGEARAAIEDCIMLDPEEGYERAKTILKSLYGTSHLISRSYIDELVHGPAIKANDVNGLMNLALDMEKCQMTLSKIGFFSDIDNGVHLRTIVRRMPMNLQSKWIEKASSIIESGMEPSFDDLLRFVCARAKIANTVYGYDLCTSKTEETENPSEEEQEVVSRSTMKSGGRKPLSCVYCQRRHKLVDCEEFHNLNQREKEDVVYRFKMCTNCIDFKHVAMNCDKANACKKCDGKHHTLLHPPSPG